MKKLIFIILLVVTSLCYSIENVIFELTEESIEYFKYNNFPEVNQFSVIIKLNAKYTEKFNEVTSKNIGNILTIKYGSTTLVEAKVQVAIPSGSIVFGKFSSSEESIDFMKKLLKQNYNSKKKSDEIDIFHKPKMSYKDSLMMQVSTDYMNFNFKSANENLVILSKMITPESDNYASILVSHFLLSLRANRFEDAEKYLNGIKKYISQNNVNGLDYYKNDEILPILILIGKGKLTEAKKLKNKFEKNTNISVLYSSLNKLPYTYRGGSSANIEKEIEEINKATDFLISLPFYSFICYKYGETQKAIEAIDVLLKTYDNQGQVKDNSHYLLKQMYLLSDNSLTEALKLSNKTIMYDLKISKYDTIQSKLWHSIILYKNGKVDDAVQYFLAAEYEFKSVNQIDDLSLKFLLTPSVGIFPNEEIYKVFDEIEKLSRN